MDFCDGDHPECVLEKARTLNIQTILTLVDACKTVVNERYLKSTKPIRKAITCPECDGSGISISDKSTSLDMCDTCKGNGSILINIQNTENIDEIKEYDLNKAISKCKTKYPAGTFFVGYPETKDETSNIIFQGISFNDKEASKFRDNYQNFRGYTYFRWVSIDNIDFNEYSLFSLEDHKKLVKTIRTYLCATNDDDIIISYKNKTYFAPGQYQPTVFGSSILVTYRELITLLTNRIEIENRKNRSRVMSLGFSCIDTGKTIYVGSDECHGCKCYNGSNGQKVSCKIHKLDK